MPKGGFRANAGRPTHRFKVSDCRDIDIRSFQQAGALRRHWTGSWYWWRADTMEVNYKIFMWSYEDQVWLQYLWQGQQAEQTVHLERTACFFGGTRPWFLCPGCRHRVAALYLHAGTFRCRLCHDLRYECQSEDAISRTWRSQTKVERSLGQARMRPKGMHKATYERLRKDVNRVERERRMLVHAGLRRMLGLDQDDVSND